MPRPITSGFLLWLSLAAMVSACAGPAYALPPTLERLPTVTAQPPATATSLAPVSPFASATPLAPATQIAQATDSTPPDATQTLAPTAIVTGTLYTVQAGDTFWGIAQRFGVAPDRLLDANPSINPDVIHPGDVLFIPNADAVVPTSAAVAATRAAAPTGTSAPTGATHAGYDYITGISDHARQVFQLGQQMGNQPNVFSKVGDSITVSPVFLSGIGGGNYDLHEYTELQGVIDFYRPAIARGSANSFTNVSLAAKVSWRARAVLSPASADPAICAEGEAPLSCEYRLVRPAVALIMLGTNDVPSTSDDQFEADMRRVLDLTLERGIIPVLSTIPPLFRAGLEGRSEQLNVIIVRLAREYDIPLWDYWAALQGLPNNGMARDGVHPNSAPAGHSADFAPEYLQYGMVVRNLTALYALDAVWRQVIQP